MNANNILDVLVNFYCERNAGVDSILIDGPWGCGKTYGAYSFLLLEPHKSKSKDEFLYSKDENKRQEKSEKQKELKQKINETKKELKIKKQKIYYVSLFGVKSIEDVAAKVYNLDIHKCSKEIKKISSLISSAIADLSPFSSISNAFKSISNLIYDPNSQKADTDNPPKLKKGYIIIFDDLERVDNNFSYISLLGYFNTLRMSGVRIVCLCSSENIRNGNKQKDEFNEFKEKSFDRIFNVDISSEDIERKIMDTTGIIRYDFNLFYEFFNNNLRMEIKVYNFFNLVTKKFDEINFDYRNQITNFTLFYACTLATLVVFKSKDSNEVEEPIPEFTIEDSDDEEMREIIKETNAELHKKIDTMSSYYPLDDAYEENMEYIFNKYNYKDDIDDYRLIKLTRCLIQFYVNDDFKCVRSFFDSTTLFKEGDDIKDIAYYSQDDNIEHSKSFLSDLKDKKRKLRLEDLFFFLKYTLVNIDDSAIEILKNAALENHDEFFKDYNDARKKSKIKILNEKQRRVFNIVFCYAQNNYNPNMHQNTEALLQELAQNGRYFDLYDYYIQEGMHDVFLRLECPDIMPNNDYFYPDLSSTIRDKYAWIYCKEVAIDYHDDRKYQSFLDSLIAKHQGDVVVERRVNYLKAHEEDDELEPLAQMANEVKIKNGYYEE